jgi:hypothetical protein
MNVQEMKKWIDGATYEDLLRKQRFEPVGSPWFLEQEVADHFFERMKALRSAEGGLEEHVRASKAIGWDL